MIFTVTFLLAWVWVARGSTAAASSARRPAGFLGILGTLRRAARPGGGLIGGDAMRASLRQLLGEATFADTRLGFGR